MPEQLYNSVVSYINQAGGMDDTATTVQLLDTGLFPDTGDYRVLIESELLLVASHAAGLLTVTRGIEGTIATAHSNQLAVILTMTAGGFVQYVSEH